MSKRNYPPEFLELLKSVKARRPRTVIDHILEKGQITTEELKDIYGYNHPPRAIRDVREHGIPIETFRVTGSDGRKIAAYKFGNPSAVRAAQLSGRTAFSCRSCYWAFPESYSHVAMREIRRLDILWVGEEVIEFHQLKETAEKVGEETPAYVKNVLKNHLEREGD